jgi:hypothetical protein
LISIGLQGTFVAHEMPIEFVEGLPGEPGDSTEQREAEKIMIAALGVRLTVALRPGTVSLPAGGRVEVDGKDADSTVFVEALAHQGPPKAGQVRKVAMDAFKLAFLARAHPNARSILLFGDPQTAAVFTSEKWIAQAIRTFGISVETVDIPADLRSRLVKAQARQFR